MSRGLAAWSSACHGLSVLTSDLAAALIDAYQVIAENFYVRVLTESAIRQNLLALS